MGAPGTTEKVIISKCPCGDRMCSSYRLSNQGSAGFELEDARQMAASGALYDALKEVNALIAEGAVEGFNPLVGDWAERLFHSQQKTSAALKLARGESS